MDKKKSIWSRMNIAFWKGMKKIGVWDWCPNCESAYTGGHPDPEDREDCIVCGQNKKLKEPNGWVWGWVVPMFLQRWMVGRRVARWNRREKRIDDFVKTLEAHPELMELAGVKQLHPNNHYQNRMVRDHLGSILDENPKLSDKIATLAKLEKEPNPA